MKQFLLALTICLVALPFSGCSKSSSKELGTLSGKVTYDGEPVSEGEVTFIPAGEGVSVQVKIKEDGTYNVQGSGNPGLSLGEYKVTVTPPLIVIPDTATSPGGTSLKPVKNIPPKYHNPNTSGLKVTVSSTSAETFDIEMKK
ncbi:carboxypeptidase-like regulatory domain-containing protein [Planctomicrobium sp. SH527]|uniref:carboxypeptidase-like regulatory domain-containing protein n=1 Tax=Planctomicrobium sp. SH527 TaxID=3448123 RepID=UPI003F5C55F1